jgi:hypothetical protein
MLPNGEHVSVNYWILRYGKRDAAIAMNIAKLYGTGAGLVPGEETAMKLFQVVVWKLKESKSGKLVRDTAVTENGSAMREVIATSAEKAELKVVAAMAGEFDPETMEVAVADPFADL